MLSVSAYFAFVIKSCSHWTEIPGCARFVRVCSAVWKDCNGILSRVKCQFAACLTWNLKGVTPPVSLHYPMTLMDLSDMFWFCCGSSGAVRAVHSDLETEQSFGPLPEDQSFCWSPRDRSVKGEDWQDLARWQDHEIGAPLSLVEKKSFGCRFREECRAQLFMTSLLACWNYKLIYGYSALVIPLSTSSPLAAPATPSWPQLCRQRSFAHLARCFFHIERVSPPTTDYKCYKMTLLPNNDSVVCLFTSGNVESCLDEDEADTPAGTSDTDTLIANQILFSKKKFSFSEVNPKVSSLYTP